MWAIPANTPWQGRGLGDWALGQLLTNMLMCGVVLTQCEVQTCWNLWGTLMLLTRLHQQEMTLWGWEPPWGKRPAEATWAHVRELVLVLHLADAGRAAIASPPCDRDVAGNTSVNQETIGSGDLAWITLNQQQDQPSPGWGTPALRTTWSVQASEPESTNRTPHCATPVFNNHLCDTTASRAAETQPACSRLVLFPSSASTGFCRSDRPFWTEYTLRYFFITQDLQEVCWAL